MKITQIREMVSRDPSYSELSDEQLKDRINAMLELRVKQCETVDPETAAYYSSISFPAFFHSSKPLSRS